MTPSSAKRGNVTETAISLRFVPRHRVSAGFVRPSGISCKESPALLLLAPGGLDDYVTCTGVCMSLSAGNLEHLRLSSSPPLSLSLSAALRIISCAHTRDNNTRDRSKPGKEQEGGEEEEEEEEEEEAKRYHEFNDSVDFTTAIAPPLL